MGRAVVTGQSRHEMSGRQFILVRAGRYLSRHFCRTSSASCLADMPNDRTLARWASLFRKFDQTTPICEDMPYGHNASIDPYTSSDDCFPNTLSHTTRNTTSSTYTCCLHECTPTHTSLDTMGEFDVRRSFWSPTTCGGGIFGRVLIRPRPIRRESRTGERNR